MGKEINIVNNKMMIKIILYFFTQKNIFACINVL